MTTTIASLGMELSGLPTKVRRKRPGPEAELVDWFIEASPISIPTGCRATVFREPKLESGYPDLVLVIWNTEIAKQWNPNRAVLTHQHLRLMQFILEAKSVSFRLLTELFSKKIGKHLHQLEEVELVNRDGDHWTPRGLPEVFATQSIVAIEAKMTEWGVAINQAFLNTWFASASYVLFPRTPKRSTIIQSALSRGVGVWTQDDIGSPQAAPNTGNLPVSYASWLFNEWACHNAWNESQTAIGPPDGYGSSMAQPSVSHAKRN